MTDKQLKLWERRKENAKFYRDLAKLSFGALVVGEFPLIKDGNIDIVLLFLGSWCTFIFAFIGNRYLKI